MKKKILFIILSLLIPSMIFADCDYENAKIDALKSVANAYYYRGGALQYDDISMTRNGAGPEGQKIVKKRRSILEQSPEEATMQDIRYTVCSEYVHGVFYEAFNKDGSGYKIRNTNGDDLGFLESSKLVLVGNPNNTQYYNERIAVLFIDYENDIYTVNDSSVTINSTNYKQVFESLLKPGDIIVYKYQTWGHVLLYLGGDQIINASSTSRNKVGYQGYSGTGGSYNYTNKVDRLDPWGTVGYVSLEEDVLNYKDKYSKYVLGDSPSTTEHLSMVSILRPFNELTNDNITTKTCNRMAHPDLVRTKTVSANRYETVQVGSNITYTITLENKSNTNYTNIRVSDAVPSNTEFVSFGDISGTKNNNNLSWIVDVAAHKTKTLSFTVKTLREGTIISNSAVADGIQLNKIETIVGNLLGSKTTNNIKALASKDGNTYANMDAVLASVYPGIEIPSLDVVFKTYFAEHVDSDAYEAKYHYPFQIDVTNSHAFGHKTESGLRDLFILKNSNDVPEKYRKMYVDGLFGGVYTIKEGDTYTNQVFIDFRNKTWDPSDFMIGDILYVYDDDFEDTENEGYMYANSINNAYIYINNSSFATVFNGKLKVLSNKETNSLIDSLLGQNSFIVLRPSNNLSITSIEVKTLPTKKQYIQNYTELDLTGGVIKVTYSDNSTDEVSMTNEGVTNSGFSNQELGNKTITISYLGKTTTFNVEVVKKEISSIKIKTKPTKITKDTTDKNIDLTGGVLLIEYNDKTTEEVPMTSNQVTVNKVIKQNGDKVTVTLEFMGRTIDILYDFSPVNPNTGLFDYSTILFVITLISLASMVFIIKKQKITKL